jgi:lipopolysaccharide/colanic/teichoic acid biosynthesis glycosyltransferase
LEFGTSGVSVNSQQTLAAFSSRRPSLLGDLAKRATDVILATIGMVLAGPVLLALGLWIKLDSKGPVFYRGLRAGRFGRPFFVLKLRTMVANAEQLGGAESPADDPRITRVGSFLRRFKFDELPQLINVIKGEMSLVGPRPEVLDEVRRYTPRELQLLSVRPGITDWASVKFRNEDELLRGSPDPHLAYHEKILPHKIQLGLEYVEKRSLLVDLIILLQTLRAVIFDVA